MSHVRKCSLDYCQNSLSTLSSIATGICEEHQKELESDKHIVGVCWSCNRITVIDEIPHKLKRVWKDKYLFTKGCTHCTIDGEDNAWLTFDKFEPEEQLYVTAEGKLIKRPSTKLRRSGETEPPGLGNAQATN